MVPITTRPMREFGVDTRVLGDGEEVFAAERDAQVGDAITAELVEVVADGERAELRKSLSSANRDDARLPLSVLLYFATGCGDVAGFFPAAPSASEASSGWAVDVGTVGVVFTTRVVEDLADAVAEVGVEVEIPSIGGVENPP